MARQVEKAFVETGTATTDMGRNSRLLIIHQYLLGHTAQILQTADEPFIRVSRILAAGAPEMKTPRVAQLVDQKMHLHFHAAQLGDDFAPVALQLPARFRLKAHCRLLARSAHLG